MKPLYALVEQFRALELIGSDEELDETGLQALEDTLDALEGEIEVKATNVVRHVLNLEAYAKAAADAGQKLAQRAKRIERRADAMREYVRVHLAGAGIKNIEGPEFTISRVANPPRVLIADGAEIPNDYLAPPDPIIAETVSAVAALREQRMPQEDVEYLAVSREELAQIIASKLPERAPDKKKIGDLLKAERNAHLAAVELAKKRGEPAPQMPKSALDGCALEQGERLAIKV